MDLKTFTYREGDIFALFCVEKYLIKNGFNKVVTELQKKLKPLIVYFANGRMTPSNPTRGTEDLRIKQQLVRTTSTTNDYNYEVIVVDLAALEVC